MPGPQEQRLVRALHGAEGGRAMTNGRAWRTSNQLLDSVATSLRTVKPPAHGGEAGALTAQAMAEAFAKAAETLTRRAGHLSDGSQALGDAGGAIETAHAAHAALGPEGSAPTYTPHEDPGSEEGIKARNSHLADVRAFQAEQARREEAARQAADRLEQDLNRSADVMAGLHPKQPDGPGGPGPGGGYPAGSATGGAGGGGHRRGGSQGVLTAGPHVVVDGVGHGTHPGDDGRDPGGPRVDYVPGHPTPNAGGTPATISSPTVPVAGIGAGSGGGLALGPAGVVAGGAAAGVIGARLGGALRGVLAGGAGSAGTGTGAAGVAGRPGTAASAVRGIGTTARSAGASTLGRSAASPTAGRSGSGAAGRSGAGNGTGRAGSRGGRRGTDDDGLDHETFDVGEDWVGGDDAGPGVLS